MRIQNFDQIFTPAPLAAQLVSLVRLRNVRYVSDFAAGKGDLLRAANNRWPDAKIFASDKDRQMVSGLEGIFKNGTFDVRDFLGVEDVASWVMEGVGSLLDVVVLNPPFSIKGTGWVETQFGDHVYKSSISLAFVVRALKALRRGGCVVAILPHGVIHSDRDRSLLNSLSKSFEVEVLPDDVGGFFSSHDVRCVILKISKNKPKVNSPGLIAAAWISSARFDVSRGSVDHVKYKGVFSKAKDAKKVIHTTGIQSGQAKFTFAKINLKGVMFPEYTSPVLLIPRVGRVTPQKIAIIERPDEFAFTQCLIVVRCGCLNEAMSTRDFILRDWDNFSKCYGGTGASYTTVDRIRSYLSLSIC